MTAKASTPAPLTVSQKIMTAAQAVISGRLRVEREPGFCLKLTRQVIEAGLGFSDGGFYRRFMTVKAEPKHEGWWARDAQKSLREAGYSVRLDELQPGDILCNHEVSKPYGHIGVYVGRVTLGTGRSAVTYDRAVLENTDSRRGFRLGGAVAVTPLNQFAPTEAFRIPDSAVRKAVPL